MGRVERWETEVNECNTEVVNLNELSSPSYILKKKKNLLAFIYFAPYLDCLPCHLIRLKFQGH